MGHQRRLLGLLASQQGCCALLQQRLLAPLAAAAGSSGAFSSLQQLVQQQPAWSGGGGGQQLQQQLQQQRRCYARDARSGSGSGSGSGRGSPGDERAEQMRQLHRQWPSLQQQMGRGAGACAPTASLRQPVFPAHYDAWQDRDPLLTRPVAVDGSRDDDLQDGLLLRQQLEASALPNEFKRATAISPAWDEVLLDVTRTVKVTKGGKVETLHALVVVGNHEGLLGVGQHSGKNIQKVTLDAQLKAYRNLVAVPRHRGRTIFHAIDVAERTVRLQAWPRQSGFGVVASPLVTELCDLAGLKDITVKLSGRRRNVRNVVRLFVDALSSQSLPHDGVEGTGVYLRERYWGHRLPCGLKRGVHVP